MCPKVRDNAPKGVLIPHMVFGLKNLFALGAARVGLGSW